MASLVFRIIATVLLGIVVLASLFAAVIGIAMNPGLLNPQYAIITLCMMGSPCVFIPLATVGIVMTWKSPKPRPGLCPKCAYPVGASEVCTECGAAVTPRPPRGVGM